MKRIYYYILPVLFVMYSTSCSKDFLTVDRYDIVEPEVLFSSEATILQGLNGVYDMLYPDKKGVDIQQNWNFKPQIHFGNYPALDCQASGWDNEFTRHAWNAEKDFFEISWLNWYRGVDRANRFIAKLKDVDPSIFANGETTKDIILAEARALRGYFYSWLAQSYGRVPMLEEGETYSNTPDKPRAETVEETWNFIVKDFSFAASKLDWTPYKGQYGRITKGMAKAYLAQSYMYLKNYASAKKELKDIIDSQTYTLEPSFGSIHAEDHWWGKESIFEVALPVFPNMNWDAGNTTDAVLWAACLTAGAGGWGALYISDEFVNSFEPGDKRRHYSVVAHGETNPYTGEKVSDDLVVGAENMPNNFSLKHGWRRPLYTAKIYSSLSCIYMRYAAVLLNYAECLFETVGEGADEDGHTGWYFLDKIRDRAWGNLEVDVQSQFPSEPIPYNSVAVVVPDAKTFYTTDPHFKSYKADLKKVAVMNERRHEFLGEYSFWFDLVRTGMAEEYLNMEYPQNSGVGTNRQFTFQPYRTVFPIPSLEIIRNPLIGPENQNPGY